MKDKEKLGRTLRATQWDKGMSVKAMKGVSVVVPSILHGRVYEREMYVLNAR